MGLYNNFPNTDYHQLNLDYIIADLQKLKDRFEGLTDESKAYTDKIREDLEREMRTLSDTVDVSLKATLDRVTTLIDNAITDFEILSKEGKIYTDKAIATLSAEVDRKLEKVNASVYNPVTGKYGTVSEAINSLYSLHLSDSLTAGEYDALQLTAETYDSKKITAINYDLQAKLILQ